MPPGHVKINNIKLKLQFEDKEWDDGVNTCYKILLNISCYTYCPPHYGACTPRVQVFL